MSVGTVARFTFTHPVEVRFRDCDPMGHVNHAVYFSYLEVARFAYWRKLMETRPGPDASIIMAHAECDYRASAETGDVLDVRMGLAGMGRSSLTYDYEIVDRTKKLVVATARVILVAYDYTAGKPIPIPDEMRERLEIFERESIA